MNELLQGPGPVRTSRHHRLMWQIRVVCSACSEESEVVVAEVDDVDREACPCGYSYVVLAVSGFEPVYAEEAEVIELPRSPRRLSTAA